MVPTAKTRRFLLSLPVTEIFSEVISHTKVEQPSILGLKAHISICICLVSCCTFKVAEEDLLEVRNCPKNGTMCNKIVYNPTNIE